MDEERNETESVTQEEIADKNTEKTEGLTEENTEGTGKTTDKDIELREEIKDESDEEISDEPNEELAEEKAGEYEKEDEEYEDEEDNDLSPTLKIIKVVLPIIAVVVCLIVLGIITFGNKDSKTKNSDDIEAEQSENSTELREDLFAQQDSEQGASEEQIKEEMSAEEHNASETPSEEESSMADPESEKASEEEPEDLFAYMQFMEVDETVTAKEITNLRDIPSTENGIIIHSLKNGETVNRTGIGDKGWSRVIYNGQTLYAVTSYLTDDLVVHDPKIDDGIKTPFDECNDTVTAKIEVNLRTIPSVTNPESVVVVLLKNGEYVTRTGINTDFGWSRVDYNGQTLYCVSSYLMESE